MNKEIEIPEGYEARIEGNKVILEQKWNESEDEKIREGLVQHLKELRSWKVGTGAPIKVPSHYDAWIAYLERMGERKYLYYDQGFAEGMRQSKSLANAEIIVSPPKITNKVSVSEELYEHIRETCACIDDALSSKTLVDITDYLEMADKSIQAAFDMLEKQKPAEWSEEDEGMLNCIIATLCEESHGGREANDKMVVWLENRLKILSPQPHWKPSEEQKPNPYTGTGFDYNGHHWGMCARDGGVEIIVDGKIKDRVSFENENIEWSNSVAKDMFIKALERAVEQTKKGYELTDCDKHSWWEDFKTYSEIKPAEWSEEDEKRVAELKTFIAQCNGFNKENRKKAFELIDSLRPVKQEWSEEDEQYLLICKNALNKYQRSDHWDANIISKWLEERLKSLCPQSSWKPSEEQMRILQYLCEHSSHANPDVMPTLESLYNDLQKLL